MEQTKTCNQTKKNGSYLSYPLKEVPSEQTGDTLLIKCLEYGFHQRHIMGMSMGLMQLKYDMTEVKGIKIIVKVI